MLLQELKNPSDFMKIDPPECVETKGLLNGENVFEKLQKFILIFRYNSKDLYKAISTSFKIYQTIWIMGTTVSKQCLENGSEISRSHIFRFD